MQVDSILNFHPVTTYQTNELSERYIRHTKIKESNELYDLYYFKDEVGQGSFGRVMEVTEKATLKTWAMKIILKLRVHNSYKFRIRMCRLEGGMLYFKAFFDRTIHRVKTRWTELQNEIKILKFVQHPHIIHLECIYETPKKMYLVFEKCFHTLQKVYEEKHPLSEKVSKVMIHDISSAVAYLHKNNIVHRDIKMQNILIARNEKDPNDEYYIKLTDFGLSIVKTGQGLESMMKDICGTLFYMPPEILKHRTYSELCDVWSIGIIMYMFLYGKKPFQAPTEEKLINLICNCEPSYEDDGLNISKAAKHLMKAMLTKTPANRITAALILDHPWMSKTARASSSLPDYNVFDVMTKWKEEMTVEAQSATSDWLIDNITVLDSDTNLTDKNK